MDSPGKTARVAGLIYLLEIVTGIFSLMYVPSQIKVHGNASSARSATWLPSCCRSCSTNCSAP